MLTLSLYSYFAEASKRSDLPNPNGSLSASVSPAAIKEANEAVKSCGSHMFSVNLLNAVTIYVWSHLKFPSQQPYMYTYDKLRFPCEAKNGLLGSYQPFRSTSPAYLHPIPMNQAIGMAKGLLACLSLDCQH